MAENIIRRVKKLSFIAVIIKPEFVFIFMDEFIRAVTAES